MVGGVFIWSPENCQVLSIVGINRKLNGKQNKGAKQILLRLQLVDDLISFDDRFDVVIFFSFPILSFPILSEKDYSTISNLSF